MEKKLTVEDVAEICNDLNGSYCRAIGETGCPPWGYAADWQKASAIEGVKDVVANQNVTAEESHNGWMAFKEKGGWKYGPKKDPEKKEHPCMVPYSDLPVFHKVKDHLFKNTVKALIPMMDLPGANSIRPYTGVPAKN